MPIDERVLVDYRTADDAGVYKLDEDRALVQTVDFFTPIVDDPFTYGRIAAANALSDVYAMGGRPLTALAVAGFPKDLDVEILASIFAGGLETLRSAGVSLLGGHTVQDQEIKFGYAVTGEVHPRSDLAQRRRAHRRRALSDQAARHRHHRDRTEGRTRTRTAVAAAVASMVRLNRGASEALQGLPADAVHACTDVTGFGLIGHGCEVAAASGVTLEIDTAAVPVIDGRRVARLGKHSRRWTDQRRPLRPRCSRHGRGRFQISSSCFTTPRRPAGCSSVSTKRTRPRPPQP